MRRGDLLLYVSGDFDGFDDLLGLLRADTYPHRVEFGGRDELQHWREAPGMCPFEHT